MTDKRDKNVSKASSNPAQLLAPGVRVDASDDGIRGQRLREVADMVFHLSNASEEDMMAKIARAIELYEDLKPADGLEGMLAIQMVGTHEAATECLRRAALQNQTFEGRDLALKHAAKLMALYLKQVAALDKHRGKGQQKVTVEHVHVAPGGQAIVGNIETNGRAASPASGGSTIEQHVEVPVETGGEKATTRRRKPKLD
ncbi:hypothetical protein JQX09_21910 [Sulfitobacter pseudonitzschiae]|uniref:Uncharacterized protein n=1 Tax=Pseudosulfitobacter pseudonitzschiae TaxID=1402135 RepID=A0A9Q2NPW2_9RHOB|nr:hypothetical protein [Pseudosulfitobacter pseudonitzschiae]MBM2294581.1 hypothetical protein [Pseudosulfitobacter pseudonitzschiae]MBM2299548.1 hypothetical protein [Pseudosulfitobacter pseudonitzschiae]MBM2304448.1 hypothetical protein [Pseudosulfitobacter pseudonitzschiae]MBM2314193.1 hypothetical protein [Pseudosulfitobacter pseudonitzschiae]MBM2319109.1 hypothetical protein [Pseudosulfitobacter pseudonitzschiae]